MSKFLKIAFRIHGIYFIIWAAIFDFFVDSVAKFLSLSSPQTMIGWVATDVASGGLLVIATLLFFASLQNQIPRFVLGALIVQTAYNLYHDAVWFWNGYHFWLVLLDSTLIGALFITYIIAWQKIR